VTINARNSPPSATYDLNVCQQYGDTGPYLKWEGDSKLASEFMPSIKSDQILNVIGNMVAPSTTIGMADLKEFQLCYLDDDEKYHKQICRRGETNICIVSKLLFIVIYDLFTFLYTHRTCHL
jgi:hypothetical protein